MPRLLILVVLLSACASPVTETTSTAAGAATTTRPLEVTTTTPPIAVTTQGCATPPVTFSTLCEVHELLEKWYVDAPVDDAALAEAAVAGLDAYVTSETEDPPRALVCAVPDVAFTVLCDALARRIEETHLPVGPAVEAATSYMIDAVLDPFTFYLPPDQAGSYRLNGIVGGIGVLLDARDAVGSKCSQVTPVCRLEVVLALEGNPGHAAGLVPGDIITAVDGIPVEGRGFTSVIAAIAGDESGKVTLTLEREGAQVELTIERAPVTGATVEYGVPIGDVGYIRIPDFETDIPPLVIDSLVDIAAEAPDTIVVDLRDNPGGYVEAVVEVASEFIDGGVVMQTDAPDEHLVYEATPGGSATGPRLVVLVNQGTASAAEILAGALRDRRDAVIVGSATFGKDAVQIPFTLRNGGEFHVAVARWSSPLGASVGGGGMKPDVDVSWPSEAPIAEIIQLALEAAS